MQSGLKPFLAKNHGLPPLDFCQNFKLAKTFCIRKGSREMMFGVVLRVIRSKSYQSCLKPFLGKNHGLPPLDFGQNFKLAITFCIGKRSREMMFGAVLIGSKSDAKWFRTVFGQKPWTPPFGFLSKFQIG